MEEITYTRVIAITKNNLALKMLFVMSKFFFNVRELSIKLIFFIGLCRV